MNKRLFLAAILIIAPALLPLAVAQDHGPPAGGSDRSLKDSASDLKGRSNEIERIGRDAKKPETRAADATKPGSPPVSNFAEIKEDFERIQIVNGDVLQLGAASAKPDYDRVSESAAEIHKRATRLSSNLFPPKSTKKPKGNEPVTKESEPVTEDKDLKSLLALLDNSIGSFAQNPMFQNTRVVNPEDAPKAQKDLDEVIKISARIRNEADRIKKATSPPE